MSSNSTVVLNERHIYPMYLKLEIKKVTVQMSAVDHLEGSVALQ